MKLGVAKQGVARRGLAWQRSAWFGTVASARQGIWPGQQFGPDNLSIGLDLKEGHGRDGMGSN
jgi:hypothetical protein